VYHNFQAQFDASWLPIKAARILGRSPSAMFDSDNPVEQPGLHPAYLQRHDPKEGIARNSNAFVT
jgi:hypothetical protein